MVVQKSHPIVKPLGVKKRNGMNYSNNFFSLTFTHALSHTLTHVQMHPHTLSLSHTHTHMQSHAISI